ncbi:UNC-like C-terminal-domain-containing protein [Ampelomyces quisqualis]|uniref:UNC-like C-terminal-domain-containing protein n=1 Tax=Ampelomyces quisqualis TaxID=50730 RepID=A0A6A5QJ98_AMPQU|nr:UNC-like C-terminal-domain-containing protein [Ampelomyces quisqualis]
MPAIGASLRKWTVFLLLCSVSKPACSQPTNKTAAVEPRATASSSTTAPQASSVSSPSTWTRSYISLEASCPFRTINYITNTLPQQCAKTSWSAPGEAASVGAGAVDAKQSVGPRPRTSETESVAESKAHDQTPGASTPTSQAQETGSANSAYTGSTASEEAEPELETDSPLDNANFLSFEEWKRKNLAQVGQSPENVGQGRAAPSQVARRRPVNVNALDSLGEEAEIELDFSGFGPPPEGGDAANNYPSGSHNLENTRASDEEKKASPSSWALSKDAGKTCKERFNYASFDCAATVLKTNKQAKSATSVLVENKDSYMLNECSAENKFLIVELCDDILVDTVVLANYEFFSSMFRHFRVSVSDRYPVKIERWKTLATFEARNSRDMQPFLITEPQIWARYLRIEFLTQYGNEFYCPLSLLRVHGTTMMEQFRREEEGARGVDDDVELETEQEVVKPAVDSGPIPADQVPVVAMKENSANAEPVATDGTTQSIESSSGDAISSLLDPATVPTASPAPSITGSSSSYELAAAQSTSTARVSDVALPMVNIPSSLDVSNHVGKAPMSNSSEIATRINRTEATTRTHGSSTEHKAQVSTTAMPKSATKSSQAVNTTIPTSRSSVPGSRIASNNTVASSQAPSPPRPSGTQPNPAAPSTQESFFKSIHKRLLYLEANSTLSLQYIEEQSRILRDAFMKVEKRQLVKTEKFLNHLNSTVMNELKSFRTMYDQLWQSTVIELESMKERQKSEMSEIGTRLSLMADELVWQKRMAVVQSTLLLLCLGLVLFVRSGTLGSAADVPIVRQLGSKYSSFFESSPPRSPPVSGIARRRRTLKHMWRSDTSVGLSDHQSEGPNVLSDADTDSARSPLDINYSPPTPDTPGILAEHDLRNGLAPTPTSTYQDVGAEASTTEETTSPDEQAKRLEVLETQSGPATPNGTRDSRPSWEEVDRAMDQLKTKQIGQTSLQAKKKAHDMKNKKRSPLRRAHSSYNATADAPRSIDSGDDHYGS